MFVYKFDDADSLEVAQHYQSKYNLDDSQLVPIVCSSTEILSSSTLFQSEVEDQVINHRVALSGYRDPSVIILGYGVPGGFYDGIDTISSTSRISRMDHTFDKMGKNYFYDANDFRRYRSGIDLANGYIVARIDGPTKEFAKSIIDNGQAVRGLKFAPGKFDGDPGSSELEPNGLWNDGPQFEAGPLRYQTTVSTFLDRMIDYLGMDYRLAEPHSRWAYKMWYKVPVTTHSIFWEHLPPQVNSGTLNDDSLTTVPGVLFYNAGASYITTVRESISYDSTNLFLPTSTSWGYLALNAGYAVVLGSMWTAGTGGEYDRDVNGTEFTFELDPIYYLDAESFFDSMYRGATFGEAYLSSSEIHDSPFVFFGDPLLELDFKTGSDYVDDGSTDETNVSTNAIMNKASELMGYSIKASTALANARTVILESDDRDTELALLVKTDSVTNGADSADSLYGPLSESTIHLANAVSKQRDGTNFANMQAMFDEYDLYITEFLDDQQSGLATISSSRVLETGKWIYEFYLSDDLEEYAEYHFVLQVATDACFANVILEKNSSSSQDGWQYRDRWYHFLDMTDDGVTPSFARKTVRYISQDGDDLTRGQDYYVRIKQWDTVSDSDYVNHDSTMMVSS